MGKIGLRVVRGESPLFPFELIQLPKSFEQSLFLCAEQSPVIVKPLHEYVVFSLSFNGFFMTKSRLLTDKLSFPFLITKILGLLDI